jgi:Ca2+-binding RTX toxin-like protein
MNLLTNSLLAQSLTQATTRLQNFAQQPDFLEQLRVAFGDRFDSNLALDIASQFRSGDFSLIPDLRILSNGELGDANGAYAGDLDEIFVSSDFLAQRQGDVPAITNLLLEEFGHKLDRLLNRNVDSPGDEGAIFAALAQGQALSTDELAQLRAEDDHRTIVVDGKAVEIEMETWTGTAGDDGYTYTGTDLFNTLYGLAGNDTLFGGAGTEVIYGGDGNDYLSGGNFFGDPSGNDILYGEAGNDTLLGRDGNDYLYGGTGNDSLYGGTGNDSLYGGTGNDTYIFNAAIDTGVDLIDETSAGGIDTLDFSDYATNTQSISVNLSSTTIQTVAPGFQITISGDIENVIGGNGNDSIYGNSLDNILSGGAGNDSLSGGTGNDFLYGGTGNDDLNGGTGNDNLYGGDGNDLLFGDSGNDDLNGGDGDDILSVGVGNGSYLYGGAGNDKLFSSEGDDSLYGGTGNDTYIFQNSINFRTQIIDESFGNGIDTLDFSSATQAIKVDLSSTTIQTVMQISTPNLKITISGDVENVIGGNGNDTLYGNSLDNTLKGGDGNDYLYGDTGNDYLYGGAGNDTLDGGAGNNTFYGGAGNNYFYGWTGNDTYIFNAAIDLGADIVNETYGGGIDTLDFSTTTTQGIGITLNSTTIQTVAPGLQITINGSIENVIGGGGNDYINGNSLDNTLNGGDGNDYLSAGNGNDTLFGDAGNDNLNGDAGNDNLYGGDGNDNLDGDAGDDNLYGGDGNDFLFGGTGDDYLISGNGNDFLIGEDGNDYLSAGNGDDYLIGNAGNDTLYGGFGNDILNGAAGNDTLNGAAGNDTYRFNAAIDTGADIVDETSGSGIDTLDFSSTTTQAINVNLYSTTIQTVSPGLQLTINGDIENVIGGSINDSIVGNSLDNTLSGDAGDDYLTGGAGNDTLFGGTGSDLIYGDAGNDTLYGDAGDDTLYDLGGGNDLLVGGDGNDTLYGDVGNDTLTGGTGNDTYYLSYTATDLTNDTVIENPGEGTDLAYAIFTVNALADNVENLTLLGTDNINGNGNGLNNIITGNDGNNILDGGAGNDSLYGGLGDDFLGDYGGGNDLIVGGDGNDGLYGGAGTDTLIGGMGNDSYYLSYVPSDLTNDTITENLGEGIDTAYAIFTVTALAANVENLTLLGSSNINGTGNSLDNQLLGNSGNNTLDGGLGNDFIANFYNTGSNTLIGGDGNDILYGGGANDTLIGGNGDDTYYLSLAPTELATDTITETTTGGMDNAISLSTVGLLADNIENLFLVGSANINATGNASNNIILGNSGNNTINGGDGNDFVGDYAGGDDALSGGNGNDTLSGGAGSDTLSGGNGDDLYYISSAPTELNDTIIELANGGTDTAVAYATVTQLADNVENLYLSGTANIDGTGNSIDNTILGNSGNNSLFGGAGNDFLGDYAGGNDTFNGGAGNDIIFGGTGIDSFVFSGNSLLSFQTALGVDNIADFTVADDIILLSKGNFGSLGTAVGNSLLSADFATVTTDTATTLGSSIVYNSVNGKLFYDANGSAAGFGSGGQFAQLSSGLGLTGNQFKAIV